MKTSFCFALKVFGNILKPLETWFTFWRKMFNQPKQMLNQWMTWWVNGVWRRCMIAKMERKKLYSILRYFDISTSLLFISFIFDFSFDKPKACLEQTLQGFILKCFFHFLWQIIFLVRKIEYILLLNILYFYKKNQ